MNAYTAWLADNDRYLGDVLAWLRARLQYMALRSDGENCAAPDASSTFPQPPTSGTTSAAGVLCDRLELGEFELQVLLLCAAVELDTGIGVLCADAQRDAARPYPTFALAMTLFPDPAWEALSPASPLRYWQLIEVLQAPAQPLVSAALKIDERVFHFLKGLNYLDERLASSFVRVAALDATLPPSQAAIAATILHRTWALAGDGVRTFHLTGDDAPSKQLVARRVSAQLGLSLYRLDAQRLPQETTDLERFIRLWHRECALLPMALSVDAGRVDRMSVEANLVRRLSGQGATLTFVETHEPWPGVEGEASVEIARPTPGEQHIAWQTALDDALANEAGRLAAQFDFDVATIERIARRSSIRAPDGVEDRRRLLWCTCVGQARRALDELAQAIEPKATLADLELPDAEMDQLRQIAAQARHRTRVYDDWGFRERMSRGFGISVLFAGESGTGKTMAAEAIASELQLPLYCIDLSTVVSKYIGETEKNLRRICNAAEAGGAILFFDEADALFGKRSEVKDSHDRYANIEINYLLQRIEQYRGVAILATNMRSAIDNAFLRRLRFVVNFPFPGVTERAAIWRKLFPAGVPIGELDFDRLAQLNLTGGSIHAIGLNAAFRAAGDGTPLDMGHVLASARAEFRKLERPVSEADFRWEPAGASP